MKPSNNSVENNTLAAAVYELVEQLRRPQIPVDDELWSNLDVANYLKLSLDTIERYVITRPDFPDALQPCPTGKRAAKRWFSGEVRKWAKQNKGTLPAPRARKNNQSRREATSEAVGL